MNYLNTWQLENSYADLPKQFYTPINPTPVNKPSLIIFNKELSKELGIDLPDDKELLEQIFQGISCLKKLNPFLKLMPVISLVISQFLVMVAHT